MLITLVGTNTPQHIAAALTGQAPLKSDGGLGGIISSVIGLMIGIAAVMINYRRNHSYFYALLAFFFSEFYLAFVLVKFVIAKTG